MILEKKSPLLFIISLVILILLSYIISISFMNVQMNELPKNPWDREVIYPSVKEGEGDVKQNESLETNGGVVKKGLMGKKSMKILIFTLPVIFVLFILITLFMLMGWDKGILRSSVSGYIYDQKSLPVKNVSIKIGEQTTTSDEKGYYKIENLDYGSNKAVINATDYETLYSDVTLSRGENPDRNFTLKQVTYSYIEGILLSNRESIDPASLKLTVGDKVITVNTDKTFKSEQLTGGKIVLSLTSSIYRDVKLEVNLTAGKNIVNDLSLAPAKDFNLTVSDWLTGDKVEGAKLTGGNVNLTSNKDGVATVIDLDDGAKLDLKVSKSNYIEKTFAIQNVGTDSVLEIIPSGKIAYLSNREGKANVYSSNHDGSDEKKLTDGKGQIFEYVIKDNLVYFYSDRDSIKGENGYIVSQIYTVPLNGGSIKKITDFKGRTFVSGNLYRSESVFLDEGYYVVKILPENYEYYDTNGSEQLEARIALEVRKLDGTLLSTIKNFGHGKFYSQESSLFKPYREISILGVDPKDNSVITSITYNLDSVNNPYGGEYYIQKLSPSGNVKETKVSSYPYNVFLSENAENVFFYSYNEVEQKGADYIYNFASGKSKLAADKASGGSFINLSGNILLGIKNFDQKKNIHSFDLGSNTVSPVTSLDKVSSFGIVNSNTVLMVNDTKVYILRIGRTPKLTSISLTPAYNWSYEYSYSDGM